MPSLEWVGKNKVINHHQEVPFRVLNKKFSINGIDDNMIIHGDNLVALKSILPKYENKVDIIYIDPPYNTGTKEGQWIYSDNVDHPVIKKWLGEVVGAEGEDLTRHDKWLSMMYPRLRLLNKLLSETGVIFISIDDNEVSHLKLICDDIFGRNNFIALLSVENNPKGRKNQAFIAGSNDYCLVYAKDKTKIRFVENIPKNKKDLSLDENGKLVHNSGKRILVGENEFNNKVTNFSSDKHYSVYYKKDEDLTIKKELKTEDIDLDLIIQGYRRYVSSWGNEFVENTYTHEKFLELYEDEALDFKESKIYEKNFKNTIRLKSIITNQKYKTYRDSQVIDFEIDVKTTSAGTELKKIFDTKKPIFPNPKNKNFIQLLITLIEKKDALVLDCFSGSGTTAHAILELNSNDGGKRKFILIELMDYAERITAERVKRVIQGYSDVKGTGGGFSFYELGNNLFNEDGNLNENIPLEQIRQYVYYTETKNEVINNPENKFYLGTSNYTDYYFYYKKNELTILNHKFLETIIEKNEQYVIYADACMLSDKELEKYRIMFKKIPRDITKV